MTSGPRSGQLVMQNAVTRIRSQRSVVFTQIRSDHSVCTPTRANLMSGLSENNHQVAGFDPRYHYYDPIRLGRRQALPGITPATNRLCGPMERDRALQRQQRVGGWGTAGAITQAPRDESADAVSGTLSSQTRSPKDQRYDATDDLQYWTGSLPTWLAKAGVTCGLIGKYSNCYARQATTGLVGVDPAAPNGFINEPNTNNNPAQTELFVPPGWSYWACLNGSDDPTDGGYGGGCQDHYAARHCVWEGTGDPFADAQGPAAQFSTFYKRPITSLTRVGSVATLVVGTHGAALAPQGHQMVVGDEFAVEGATDAGWNYFMWTVASVVDANTITFNLAGTRPAPVTPQPPALPATNTASGTMFIYPRNQYGESLWGKYGQDFIAKRKEGEPWFLYYAPDNPHDGSTDVVGTQLNSNVEVEKRYDSEGLAAPIDWANIGLYWEGLRDWFPDRTGPCTFTSGATRIFAAARRDDGSGPFDQRSLNKLVSDAATGSATGTYITAGTTVIGVDTSLPGGTGGWVDISNPTLNPGTGSPKITIGTVVANPLEYVTSYRKAYARRQGMLASADDTIGQLLDACEARGWHNVTLIVTSDNGWSQGEWNTYEAAGSTSWYQKGRVFEGSVRCPLWMKGPDFPVKTTSQIVGSMKDVPLTILDVFGNWGAHGPLDLTPLTTHHAHTKRDGHSLLRLLKDPTDAERDRSVSFTQANGFGSILGGADDCEGIVDKDGMKLIRQKGDTTLSGLYFLFDTRQDAEGRYLDFEATDLKAVYPALVTTLNDRLNRMRVGHWLPSTQVNGHRAASIT